MTERMEAVLNGLTIVGMVLVSFILVVGVAITGMFLAGYFDDHKDPLVGLKFSTTEDLVIEDHEGVVYLTVYANTAELGEDGSVDDNTVDTDITLTVRNANNVKDDTIIDVPTTVKKGVPFAIRAKTLEDGYNKGGVSYIYAETSDMMYRVSQPIAVKVNVPVDSINLVARDPTSGQVISLSDTKFIFDDTAQLSVEVIPERARYIYGDTTKTKDIIYISSNPQSVNVGKDSGLLNVEYNPVYNSEEPLETPLDTVVITAKINKNGDNSEDTQVVTTKTLGLYPLQLGQILIKNETFSDEASVFATDLFNESNVLRISAEETGLTTKTVQNLRILLQPTIVKDSQGSDYSPITDLSGFEVDYVVEYDTSISEARQIILENNPAIDIVPYSVNNGGKMVKYWEIVPNRLFEAGETVWLTMNVSGHSDNFEIRRKVEVSTIDADVNSFTYTNNSDVEITNVRLDITKYDENPENNVYNNFFVKYNFSNSTGGDTSFKNVVTFVNPVGQNEHINVNEVNSPIVVASEINQIKPANEDGFLIEARGAGQVSVAPYLVRTNKMGQPVDINYNVITTDEALWDVAGYVKPAGLCKYNNLDFALSGEYIWYQTFRNFTVTISERLTSLKLYKDLDEAEGNPFYEQDAVSNVFMGTNTANSVTIFAKPNSVLAVPDSVSGFNRNLYNYSDIELSEQIPDTASAVFDLKQNIMNDVYSYGNNSLEYTEAYLRWIKFNIIANSPTALPTSDFRSLLLKYSDGQAATTLNVEAINVNISNISINGNFSQSANGMKFWNIYSNILDGAVKHDDRYYAKLSFIDEFGNSPEMPDAQCGISEEDRLRGLKAPSSQNFERVFYMFPMGVYTVNEVRYDTLSDMIATALMTDDTEQANAIWAEVNQLIRDSLIGGKNPAEDYIQQTNYNGRLNIDIKKELPTDHQIFMFYIPMQGGSTIDFATVKPDIVRINYSWPSFVSKLTPVGIPNNAQDPVNNTYFIYNFSDDIDGDQSVRKFDYTSLTHSNVRYNTSTGTTMVSIMNNFVTPTISPSYLEGSREEEQDTENVYYVFKIKADAPADADIDVAITRSVIFVTDITIGYDTWVDMVADCVNNGGSLQYGEYKDKITRSSHIEQEWVETIKFKVKKVQTEVVDPGEDGGSTGE